MALQAVCPECGVTQTLADDFTARTVECSGCRNIFAAPVAPKPNDTPPSEPTGEPVSEPTAATARPASPTMAMPTPPKLPTPPVLPKAEAKAEVKPEAGFDLVADDDEEPLPTAKAKKNMDDDRPAARSRRDEDRDDHRERPRRSRPNIIVKKGSPITVALLVFLSLISGGVAAGGAAYMMLPTSEDPEAIKEQKISQIIGSAGGGAGVNPPIDDSNKIKPTVIPNDPLAVYQTQIDKNYVTIPFTSKITDTCIGADGRFLFALLGTEQQVVGIDLCTGKLAIKIPVPANACMAAGATKLFIADGMTRKAERWDLRKMEKDLEKPLPGEGNVLAMAMGCASDELLLVANSQTGGKPIFTFVDGQTLNESTIKIEGDSIEGLANLAWLRVTPNGSHWIASPRTIVSDKTNNMARNKSIIFLRQAGTMRCNVYYYPVGLKAISSDGQTLFTRYGTTNPTFPYEIKAYPDGGTAMHVPAVNSEMEVVLSNSVSGEPAPPELNIQTRPISLNFCYDGARSGGHLLTSRVALPSSTTVGALPTEKSVYYVPEAELVATIPDTSDRVVLAKADWFRQTMNNLKVDGRLVKTQIVSSPPRTFVPGTTYRYQVRTAPQWTNTKYKLYVAPEGMTVNDDGLVTWNVPKDYNKENNVFGLVVVLKDAAPIVHTAVLHDASEKKIDPMPEPKPKDPKDPKDPMPKPKDPKDPKDPMPKPKDKTDPPLVPVDVAPGVKLVMASDKVPTLTAAEFTGATTTVPAPGAIANICAAAGGRYLLLHCPAASKIGVFDTTTAKIIKIIAVKAENVLIAASIDKFMLIYPDTKMVERWSLVTFDKEAEKKLDTKQTIIAAAMGHATNGPLVLGGPKAQDNASKMGLMFIDLPTLKEVKIDKAEGQFGVNFSSAAHLRVSANGKLLSAWYKDLSPTGAQLVTLADNTLTGTYYGEDAGQVVPLADGSAVGTSKGTFLPNGQKEGQPNDIIIPGVQGTGYLHVTPPEGNGRRRITVKDGANQPLATFDNLPQYDGKRDPFERDVHPLTLDQRLTYVPDAKIIVVIPPAGNKLHVFKVPPPK